MKLNIKNMAAAIMIASMSAACSNSELNNIDMYENLPLSLEAGVESVQTRAEGQAVTIGTVSSPIPFSLSLKGSEAKAMTLSTDGVISYSEGVDKKFEVNPAVDYTATVADGISNVPVVINRDSKDFNLNVKLDASENKFKPAAFKTPEGVIEAKATLPFKVSSSALYIKFSAANLSGATISTVADGFTSQKTLNEGNFQSVDGGAVYCVELGTDVEADSRLAIIAVPNAGAFEIKTVAKITVSENKLFVVSASETDVQSAASRASSSAIMVSPVSMNW